jgi:DNA-binding transcriptional LysR family regulator
MAALDVEAVQAFVLVADLQSFTRAAHALGTSQAAISVKVKRLEDRLGYRLLERTPRKVRLSVRGLSSTPQRLIIGISDQVAGPALPALLAKLNAHDPAVVIEVHIEASRNLMEAFHKGTLDAAIVRQEDHERGGERLIRERLGWFAAPHWEHDEEQPLRLASLAPTCGVRALATQALDAAGIAWTEVFIGGGNAAIGAAVSAGLAVAALPHSIAPVGALDVGQRYGLPRLPDSNVILHSALSDPDSRSALRALAASFRSGEAAKAR